MPCLTTARRRKLLLRPDAGAPGLLAVWDGRRVRPHAHWLAPLPGGVRLTKFRNPWDPAPAGPADVEDSGDCERRRGHGRATSLPGAGQDSRPSGPLKTASRRSGSVVECHAVG
jgi:hypothetical protein